MKGAEDGNRTLRDFLYILFKHKVKILTIFMVIVTGVTAWSFIRPPVYEGRARILIKFGRENIYTSASPSSVGSGQRLLDIGREERINSEVELLRGTVLVMKVVDDIGVNKIYPPGVGARLTNAVLRMLRQRPRNPKMLAVMTFQKHLEVEPVKRSDIIRITFEHKDPALAAHAVNRLVHHYIDYHIMVHQQPRSYPFFDEQVKLQSERLKRAENDFDSFRSKANVAALKEQRELLLKQISETEMNLARTRSEISENKGKFAGLTTQDSPRPGALAHYGQETELNPVAMEKIRTKLSELRLKEQDLRNRYADSSWMIRAVRRDIEEAERLLAKEEKTYNEKAVISTTHTLKALQAKEERLKIDKAKYQQELLRINSAEMRLTQLERDLKLNAENYELYVMKREESRVSNAMDRERMVNVSFPEPAFPAIKPAAPKKLLNIVLSIVLGIVCGLGLALFSEYYSHTINHPDDVERHLALPVLTTTTEWRP